MNLPTTSSAASSDHYVERYAGSTSSIIPLSSVRGLTRVAALCSAALLFASGATGVGAQNAAQDAIDRGLLLRQQQAQDLQNRLNDAADAYRQAIRLAPENPRAHSNLGGLLAQLGKDDEAREHLSDALAIDPADAQAHINLGLLLAPIDSADALVHLEEGVRLWPRDPRARNSFGYVLLRTGRIDDAAKQFQMALELDPSSAAAREGMDAVNAASRARSAQLER